MAKATEPRETRLNLDCTSLPYHPHCLARNSLGTRTSLVNNGDLESGLSDIATGQEVPMYRNCGSSTRLTWDH
jgi:hypothetical protein